MIEWVLEGNVYLQSERLLNSKYDADKIGRDLVAVTLKRREHLQMNRELEKQSYNYHTPIVRIDV